MSRESELLEQIRQQKMERNDYWEKIQTIKDKITDLGSSPSFSKLIAFLKALRTLLEEVISN